MITYGKISREGTPARDADVVRWDYTGEDPSNDLYNVRMSRTVADPSLLIDDSYHLVPSGDPEHVVRSTPKELALPAVTTVVLTSGVHLYVDHAHPEYSASETIGARDTLLWDHIDEAITQRVMTCPKELDEESIVLIKDNIDGKDAACGTHENYQTPRITDLDTIV